MRTLVAMGCASAVALFVMLFVASPVASWVVRQLTFDSPDGVADLHGAVFMGLNVIGLAVGWTLGWMLGRRWAD